jgi:hypothetical protein
MKKSIANLEKCIESLKIESEARADKIASMPQGWENQKSYAQWQEDTELLEEQIESLEGALDALKDTFL